MTPHRLATALRVKYGILGAHRLIRQRMDAAVGDLHKTFRWLAIGLALHDPSTKWE